MQDQQNTVTLPSGVSVVGYRPTSQLNAMGQIEPGQVFTLRLPDGGTTTLFIPQSLMGNGPAITAAIAQTVANLQAIVNAQPASG